MKSSLWSQLQALFELHLRFIRGTTACPSGLAHLAGLRTLCLINIREGQDLPGPRLTPFEAALSRVNSLNFNLAPFCPPYKSANFPALSAIGLLGKLYAFLDWMSQHSIKTLSCENWSAASGRFDPSSSPHCKLLCAPVRTTCSNNSLITTPHGFL